MAASVASRAPVDPHWSGRLVLLGLAIALTIAIFLPTYADIFSLWWNTSSYNHCLLIIPISCYLIWLKRDAVLATLPGVSWSGLGFIALNALLWLIGNFMSINFFQHLGAIGLIVGLIWALIGTPHFRLLLFPLFYLYFGVPEGDFLVPSLQDLTAQVVVILLRASDIPVFLEGRYLAIPSGSFHVAKACSGINYLIATLAVGTMFAYLRFRSYWRRALFMLLAILVPLAANGVRAYGIVMIAHLSDYKYALGVDHFIYGWLFFGVVIFALFSAGNLFSDVVDDSGRPKTIIRGRETNRYAASIVLLLGISVLVGVKTLAANIADIGYSSMQFSLPEPHGGWRVAAVDGSPLGSSFIGADVHRFGLYTATGAAPAAVDLEVYYYRRQAQDAEIVNFRNSVFDDERWRLVEGPIKRVVAGGPGERVHEVVLRSGARTERLVWYWYDISGATTLNPLAAKLLSKKSALLGDYRGEAAIIVSTPIEDDIESSRDVLQQFLREVTPTINRMTNDPT